MNVYNPGNVLLKIKHKDKLGWKVSTWEANEPMVCAHWTFIYIYVWCALESSSEHPQGVEIRTPRNIFNLLYSRLRVCGLLHLIYPPSNSKQHGYFWAMTSSSSFPEVPLCCQHCHSDIQIWPCHSSLHPPGTPVTNSKALSKEPPPDPLFLWCSKGGVWTPGGLQGPFKGFPSQNYFIIILRH